jgi:hypothetical protein
LHTVPLSGSVIKVLPGTYTSDGANYAIVFNRKGDVHNPVTVEPAVPGTVTIANADPTKATTGAWIIHATGLRIRGLRFQLLNRRGGNVGANAVLIEDSSRIEVVGCTFNEVSLIGLIVRGGRGTSSDDVWVIDNRFRPAGTDPSRQVTGLGYGREQYFGSKGSHWIYAGQYGTDGNWEQTSGSRRLVVVNNVFVGSTAGRDIELGPQARMSYVVNNTFYGNHATRVIGANTPARYAGQAVELFSNTDSPQYTNGFNTIANNLFVDLDGQAVAGSGPTEPGNKVFNNLSWHVASQGAPKFAPSNGAARIFDLAGQNRAGPPGLVAPSDYDFRLRRRSAALHAGASQFAYPYDASGAARPTAPAIGAFEAGCPGSASSLPGGTSC